MRTQNPTFSLNAVIPLSHCPYRKHAYFLLGFHGHRLLYFNYGPLGWTVLLCGELSGTQSGISGIRGLDALHSSSNIPTAQPMTTNDMSDTAKCHVGKGRIRPLSETTAPVP